jgi:hypothetical protein
MVAFVVVVGVVGRSSQMAALHMNDMSEAQLQAYIVMISSDPSSEQVP